MTSVFKLTAFFLSAALLTGCNLSIDVEEYPYRGQPVVVDLGAEADGGEDAVDDVADVADAVEDAPAPAQPVLIFTELMADVSTDEGLFIEAGEYLEVKNVGEAAADPRRIIIQVSGSNRRIQVNPFPSSDEEQQVFDELRAVEPGEYFVFVRSDSDYYRITDDLEAGTFYEYGRWSDAVPLTNSSRRLTLAYRTSEFELDKHDIIEWTGHRLIDPTGASEATLPVISDAAWGLVTTFEDPATNDDPAHWCLHTDELDDSPVRGSPGLPTPKSCGQ
jgi:hypothetical protein